MITVEKLMLALGFHHDTEAYSKKNNQREWRIHQLDGPMSFDQPVALWFRHKEAAYTRIFMNLAEFIAEGLGPNRIMIDEYEGRAPKLEPELDPVIIFVRDDGWLLAAPAGLEEAARRMWPKEWIAVIRKPWQTVEEP